MPISATMTPSKKCSDKSSMSNHRGFSRVMTLTSWKFEMYYFLGVLKFYVILIKFTVNWFQLAWNKESQFALWILSRLLEFRNATDWCLKRCDRKCRKLWFFKCMVAICHHVQHSNMFFFHSVQLSPAVLHIGDNGTSDHTQSNAERKTNGISHHADTSRKLPEVKLRNWYLFPERTPKSSWLNSMKSTKKTNWAATKKDPGMQFNLINLYLAVWILEPSTSLEVPSLEKQISFWSSQDPLQKTCAVVLRWPGCLCKARCLRDSKRPHQASPKCNLSTQLTPSFRQMSHNTRNLDGSRDPWMLSSACFSFTSHTAGCFDIMSSMRIAANSRKDPSGIRLGVQCLPELQTYKLFTIQHCFLFKQSFRIQEYPKSAII